MSEQSPFPERKISQKTVDDILSLVDHEDIKAARLQLVELLKPLSPETFDFVWSELSKRLQSAEKAARHEDFLLGAYLSVARDWNKERLDDDLRITWITERQGQTDERQEIQIQNPLTKETYNLSTILPADYRFVADSSYFCQFIDKTVHFNVGEMYLKGFLLKVLHEIGHAHQPKMSSQLEFSVGERLELIGTMLRSKLFPTPRTQSEELVTLRSNIVGTAEIAPDAMPDWFLEKSTEAEIQSERNAWAFALRTAQLLQKEGFDIPEDFDSYGDIKDLIEYSLLSYDIGLASERGKRALRTEYTTAPSFTHTAEKLPLEKQE